MYTEYRVLCKKIKVPKMIVRNRGVNLSQYRLLCKNIKVPKMIVHNSGPFLP